MKWKGYLCFLVFCIAPGGHNYVTAASGKKHKTYLRLIEAYTQRTLPGRQGPPPMNGDHFIIIWEGKEYPETFFWRGDGGWLSCSILKAHKVSGSHNMPKGIDYRTEVATGADIHKGDTLMLSPVTGGKFPIPKEIPPAAKNTLFFKTGASSWLSFPVKKMTEKQDIARP